MLQFLIHFQPAGNKRKDNEVQQYFSCKTELNCVISTIHWYQLVTLQFMLNICCVRLFFGVLKCLHSSLMLKLLQRSFLTVSLESVME